MARRYHYAKTSQAHLTGHVKNRPYHGWMKHGTQEFLIVDVIPADLNGCD